MEEQVVHNEFDFYLKFTKPLVLNLPSSKDRISAAAWVKRLKNDTTSSDKLKTDYLKLLLFVLQRKRLVGIFSDDPTKYETLEEFPKDFNLASLAKSLIEQEQNERIEKFRKELRGEKGDFPPFSTDYSADFLEYVAAQDIPHFGVHAFYAFSKEPLPKWQQSEKGGFPKLFKSTVDLEAAELGATGGAASEPCVCPPKVGEPSEDDAGCKKVEFQEPTSPPKKKKAFGTIPPTTPLGSIPPPEEERRPPSWGSNLLQVKDLEFDEDEIDPELLKEDAFNLDAIEAEMQLLDDVDVMLDEFDDKSHKSGDKSWMSDGNIDQELEDFDRRLLEMEKEALADLEAHENLVIPEDETAEYMKQVLNVEAEKQFLEQLNEELRESQAVGLAGLPATSPKASARPKRPKDSSRLLKQPKDRKKLPVVTATPSENKDEKAKIVFNKTAQLASKTPQFSKKDLKDMDITSKPSVFKTAAVEDKDDDEMAMAMAFKKAKGTSSKSKFKKPKTKFSGKSKKEPRERKAPGSPLAQQIIHTAQTELQAAKETIATEDEDQLDLQLPDMPFNVEGDAGIFEDDFEFADEVSEDDDDIFFERPPAFDDVFDLDEEDYLSPRQATPEFIKTQQFDLAEPLTAQQAEQIYRAKTPAARAPPQDEIVTTTKVEEVIENPDLQTVTTTETTQVIVTPQVTPKSARQVTPLQVTPTFPQQFLTLPEAAQVFVTPDAPIPGAQPHYNQLETSLYEPPIQPSQRPMTPGYEGYFAPEYASPTAGLDYDEQPDLYMSPQRDDEFQFNVEEGFEPLEDIQLESPQSPEFQIAAEQYYADYTPPVQDVLQQHEYVQPKKGTRRLRLVDSPQGIYEDEEQFYDELKALGTPEKMQKGADLAEYYAKFPTPPRPATPPKPPTPRPVTPQAPKKPLKKIELEDMEIAFGLKKKPPKEPVKKDSRGRVISKTSVSKKSVKTDRAGSQTSVASKTSKTKTNVKPKPSLSKQKLLAKALPPKKPVVKKQTREEILMESMAKKKSQQKVATQKALEKRKAAEKKLAEAIMKPPTPKPATPPPPRPPTPPARTPTPPRSPQIQFEYDFPQGVQFDEQFPDDEYYTEEETDESLPSGLVSKSPTGFPTVFDRPADEMLYETPPEIYSPPTSPMRPSPRARVATPMAVTPRAVLPRGPDSPMPSPFFQPTTPPPRRIEYHTPRAEETRMPRRKMPPSRLRRRKLDFHMPEADDVDAYIQQKTSEMAAAPYAHLPLRPQVTAPRVRTPVPEGRLLDMDYGQPVGVRPPSPREEQEYVNLLEVMEAEQMALPAGYLDPGMQLLASPPKSQLPGRPTPRQPSPEPIYSRPARFYTPPAGPSGAQPQAPARTRAEVQAFVERQKQLEASYDELPELPPDFPAMQLPEDIPPGMSIADVCACIEAQQEMDQTLADDDQGFYSPTTPGTRLQYQPPAYRTPTGPAEQADANIFEAQMPDFDLPATPEEMYIMPELQPTPAQQQQQQRRSPQTPLSPMSRPEAFAELKTQLRAAPRIRTRPMHLYGYGEVKEKYLPRFFGMQRYMNTIKDLPEGEATGAFGIPEVATAKPGVTVYPSPTRPLFTAPQRRPVTPFDQRLEGMIQEMPPDEYHIPPAAAVQDEFVFTLPEHKFPQYADGTVPFMDDDAVQLASPEQIAQSPLGQRFTPPTYRSPPQLTPQSPQFEMPAVEDQYGLYDEDVPQYFEPSPMDMAATPPRAPSPTAFSQMAPMDDEGYTETVIECGRQSPLPSPFLRSPAASPSRTPRMRTPVASPIRTPRIRTPVAEGQLLDLDFGAQQVQPQAVPVRQASPREAQQYAHIMDEFVPDQTELPPGFLDPGMQMFASPPKSQIIPSMPFRGDVVDPFERAQMQELQAFDETPPGLEDFQFEDMPFDEEDRFDVAQLVAQDIDDFEEMDMSQLASPVSRSPVPYVPPVLSRDVNYAPQHFSPGYLPELSPLFKRQVYLHKYTDDFFDPQRPDVSRSIRSGNRMVRLPRKYPRPGLATVMEPEAMAAQPAQPAPRAAQPMRRVAQPAPRAARPMPRPAQPMPRPAQPMPRAQPAAARPRVAPPAPSGSRSRLGQPTPSGSRLAQPTPSGSRLAQQTASGSRLAQQSASGSRLAQGAVRKTPSGAKVAPCGKGTCTAASKSASGRSTPTGSAARLPSSGSKTSTVKSKGSTTSTSAKGSSCPPKGSKSCKKK